MSDREPRDEAAAIARGLRRYVERERAAQCGDLLADSTRAASVARERAGANAEPRIVVASGAEMTASDAIARESRRSANAEPASSKVARATPAPEAASAPRVNLFGEVEPEPAAAATAVLDFDLPPVHAPLNPGGPDERDAILRDSLPVLAEIATEVRGCRLCGLCDTRQRAVPGTGSARSGIVFVGEAPGAEEDKQGEPFVGRAGELLTRIIKAMDDAHLIPDLPLTRETVYICNVLKCRPPENRNPLPHEVETCSPYLERQLEALKPRVICCLGKFAAELLVGVKGTIAGLRGRTYRYRGARLIVTYHPAACLRNPNLKRPVWEDMQLLAREYLSD
jgi:DNA polymerase